MNKVAPFIIVTLASAAAFAGWAAFAAGAPAQTLAAAAPARSQTVPTQGQPARPGIPSNSVSMPILPPAQVAALSQAVPDDKNIKRMAVLRGLDKIKGVATDITAPAGVPVRYGSLSITLRYCHTVPPEEPPETTAFLQIDEVDPNVANAAPKKLFSGWMFASTPALNGLEHGVYDVWVITCRTDAPEVVELDDAAAAAAEAAAGAGAPPAGAAPRAPNE
jgi:hypothetical protein